MSVWLTIPSKRPPEEAEPVLKAWRERGYKIALWLDSATPGVTPPIYIRTGLADFVNDTFTYPGYAQACNELIGFVVQKDPAAEWFICAGDDILPDPNHSAEEIARECYWHFGGPPIPLEEYAHEGEFARFATFGVMQPTGDRWGIDPNTHAFVSKTAGCNSCACQVCGRGEIAPVHLMGAYIDRVAGSPWIGREFARRMYRGSGPYWPEYTHMGVDEELQAVATKLGKEKRWRHPIECRSFFRRPIQRRSGIDTSESLTIVKRRGFQGVSRFEKTLVELLATT